VVQLGAEIARDEAELARLEAGSVGGARIEGEGEEVEGLDDGEEEEEEEDGAEVVGLGGGGSDEEEEEEEEDDEEDEEEDGEEDEEEDEDEEEEDEEDEEEEDEEEEDEEEEEKEEDREEEEGAAGGEIGVGWAEGRPGSGGRGSGSDSDREEEEKDGEEGEEEEGEEEENGDAVELPTFSSSGEEEALAMPDAAAEDGGGAVDRVPSRMLDTDAMEAVMAEEAPGPPEPKKARLSGDGGGD